MAPNANLYLFDLAGYGDTQIKDDVFHISGWSDKIFALIDRVEKKEGIAKYIENYDVQL